MSHTAKLNWAASPDAGSFGSADGYLVFKGATQNALTTQLTPSPIQALTFTDENAAVGSEWYSVVTSIGGVVSAPDSVDAVILPAAPTGLTVSVT